MTPIWIRAVAILALICLTTASPVPGLTHQVSGPAAVGQESSVSSDVVVAASPQRERRVRFADLPPTAMGESDARPELPATGSLLPGRLTSTGSAISPDQGRAEEFGLKYWDREGNAYEDPASYRRGQAITTRPQRIRTDPTVSGSPQTASIAPSTERAIDANRAAAPGAAGSHQGSLPTAYFVGNSDAHGTYKDVARTQRPATSPQLPGADLSVTGSLPSPQEGIPFSGRTVVWDQGKKPIQGTGTKDHYSSLLHDHSRTSSDGSSRTLLSTNQALANRVGFSPERTAGAAWETPTESHTAYWGPDGKSYSPIEMALGIAPSASPPQSALTDLSATRLPQQRGTLSPAGTNPEWMHQDFNSPSAEQNIPIWDEATKMTESLPKANGLEVMKLSGTKSLDNDALNIMLTRGRDFYFLKDSGGSLVQFKDGQVKTSIITSRSELQKISSAQAQAGKGWLQRLSGSVHGWMKKLASPAKYLRGG